MPGTEKSRVNHGFQHEGVCPEAPQPTYVNTHHTTTGGQPHSTKAPKARKCRCFYITIIVSIIMIITGVLLWYFLSSTCALGRRCGENGVCLSSSLWCDGKRDCLNGEDEAKCFRLYGPDFLLQSFSHRDQKWKPVCSYKWDDNIGRKTCSEIGYSGDDYVRFGIELPESGSSDGYMTLKSDYSVGEPAYSYLTESSYCRSFTAVSLKCIECGQSTADMRIVGGVDATSITRWPWQVSLRIYGEHMCGGSIITPFWIVSAAHCFTDWSVPRFWVVYAGYLTQQEMNSNNGNLVSQIISHPGYDASTHDNDIALVKLKAPLSFSWTVKPVCLPNVGLSLTAPRDCFVTGWGATYSQDVSNVLQEARVSLISTSICNRSESYNGKITDSMICAGMMEGGVDSCQGDSGGPLVTKKKLLWWLVGITSWGEGCGDVNKPGIYGNVNVFLEWIYEQMQKN